MSCTGYCAVLARDWQNGGYTWKIGLSTLIWGADQPSQFLANIDGGAERPPRTIDGYTISGVWAYHAAFRFWVEVDQASWQAIVQAGRSGGLGYETDSRYPQQWGMLNFTCTDDPGWRLDDGVFNSGRCVEVFCGRFRDWNQNQFRPIYNQDRPDERFTEFWSLSSDGRWSYICPYNQIPSSYLASDTTGQAYKSPRNNQTRVPILSYGDLRGGAVNRGGGWGFTVMDYNTIIYESFYASWANDRVFRPTTIEMLLRGGVYRTNDMIGYAGRLNGTGKGAYVDGSGWHLIPSGRGPNANTKPTDYIAGMDIRRPPDQVEWYNAQQDGAHWFFSRTDNVWHAIKWNDYDGNTYRDSAFWAFYASIPTLNGRPDGYQGGVWTNTWSTVIGNCAVLAKDWKNGGQEVWKLSNTSLLWGAHQYWQFAANPNLGYPPNNIDGYVSPNFWAYHMAYRFWIEVDRGSWEAIYNTNVQNYNGYEQSGFPNWGFVQNTSWDNTCSTYGDDFNKSRSIECISGRFPLECSDGFSRRDVNQTSYWDHSAYRYMNNSYTSPVDQAFIGNANLTIWPAFQWRRNTNNGLAVFFYKRGDWDWTAVDYNTIIYEQYNDWAGNRVYRATIVWIMLEGATDNSVNPTWAKTTGYCAVLAFDWKNGGQVWKLGTTTLLWANNQYNRFAAHTDQLPPPTTIDGYTLQQGNFWAYHLDFRFWVELNAGSWQGVQNANVSANVSYDQTGFPRWGIVQTTFAIDPNANVPDLNSARCVEIICGRFRSTDINSLRDMRDQWRWWVGWDSGNGGVYWDGYRYYNARYTSQINQPSIPYTYYTNPVFNADGVSMGSAKAFRGQRTGDTGLSIWLYKGGGWDWGAVDFNSIIYEPYNGNGTITYRATTVDMFLQGAVYGGPRTVAYSGYLTGSGKAVTNSQNRDGYAAWHLADDGPDGGSQPSDYVISFEGRRPPDNVDGYNAIHDGCMWAFNWRKRVWHAIKTNDHNLDRDGFENSYEWIRRARIVRNFAEPDVYLFPYKPNCGWTQRHVIVTGQDPGNGNNNDCEIAWWRYNFNGGPRYAAPGGKILVWIFAWGGRNSYYGWTNPTQLIYEPININNNIFWRATNVASLRDKVIFRGQDDPIVKSDTAAVPLTRDNINYWWGYSIGPADSRYWWDYVVFLNNQDYSNVLTQRPPSSSEGWYWAFNLRILAWQAVDDDSYARITRGNVDGSIFYQNASPLSLAIQHTLINNPGQGCGGNIEMVWSRAAVFHGGKFANNIFNYSTNRWELWDNNTLVCEPILVNGSILWRAATILSLWDRAWDDANNSPTNYTGDVAIIGTVDGGRQEWINAFTSLVGTGLDDIHNFTVAFNNLNPSVLTQQLPPQNIGGYSPPFRWVFHTQQLIWHAVDYNTYVRILMIGPTVALNYTSQGRIPWMWSQNSVATDRNARPGGDFEVILPRSPQNIVPPVSALTWPGQTSGTYTSDAVSVFGADRARLPAFGWRRNNSTGLQVWDFGANRFRAIDRLQVIQEPFWNNGQIWWRPNRAINILWQRVEKPFESSVVYTGNVSLLSSRSGGQSWITGRAHLVNSEFERPGWFRTIFSNHNPTQIQTQQSPYFWLNGSTIWTYHLAQMIWYEIDEESYVRAHLISVVYFYDGVPLTYQSQNILPWLYAQNTVASDATKVLNTNFEILWQRAGQGATLPVETLPALEQSVGTFTEANLSNVFPTQYSLPAFGSWRRNPSNGIQIWLYNQWKVADRDLVICEPFLINGQVWWRPNTVESVRFNVITRRLTDPVYYTGYLAVLSSDDNNQTQYWTSGTCAADNNPYNFATTLTNYDPRGTITVQAPPRGIGGYFPARNNYWCYNKITLCWHEIDEESFVRIQQINSVIPLTYLTDFAPAFFSQKTVGTDETIKPGGSLEVSRKRSPQNVPPDPNITKWIGDYVGWSSVPALAGTPAPDSRFSIWFYDFNTWLSMEKRAVIAEPVLVGGKIQWRANTLWQVWANISTSDPVIYTGRAALALNRGDIYVWKLGRSNADFGKALNYAYNISNADQSQVKLQTPPNTLEGYTITGIWAYHVNQKIWYELSRESYDLVKIANVTAAIDYYSATQPTWTYQNSTIISDGSTVPGTVDLVWGRPNQLVPKLSVTQSPGIDGNILFLRYSYPGSAFTNEVPTIGNSMFFINYNNNKAFQVMNSDQVVLESVIDNGVTKWRASIASFIAAQTPANYTGYAAVFSLNSNGLKQWKLGRYGDINGLGNWGKSLFFAAKLTNVDPNGPLEVQMPPNTIDGYTISKNSTWAYHVTHRVWYEVDLFTWQLIQKNNYQSEISYLYDVQNCRSYMPWVNRTMGMDPTIVIQGTGNMEVAYTRSGQKNVPQITSLTYAGLTGSAPHPKFGPVQSKDLLLMWNYDINNWGVLYKNDIVLEAVKLGNIVTAWRAITAQAIVDKSYTLVDPVIYTGRAVVLNYNYDGSKSWRLGRLVPWSRWNGYVEKGLPSNFAATLSNHDPKGSIEVQMPPKTVDGYTLGFGNVWAYHINYGIWFEIDQESWQRVQIAGQISNINYNVGAESFSKNNTRMDGTVVNRALEVSVIRIGQGRPPDPGSTIAFMNNSSTFDQYNDPIYGINAGQGMTIWNKNSSAWNSILQDMIIQLDIGNGKFRFVIAYILAIDIFKNDTNSILKGLYSGKLAQIQQILNNANTVESDISNRIQFINPFLDDNTSTQVNNAQKWITSAIKDLNGYLNECSNTISDLNNQINNLSYAPTSITSINDLWQKVNGLQALLDTNLTAANTKTATITAARQTIINTYTSLINGSLVPVTSIQNIIQDDLQQISAIVTNIQKTISLVKPTVSNSAKEVAKVSLSGGTPDMQNQANVALNIINKNFTTINQNLGKAQANLAQIQKDYTAAGKDISALLKVSLEAINILGTPDNSSDKGAEILQQFQVIEGINNQLTSAYNTTVSNIKFNTGSISGSIRSMQSTLDQLKSILTNVNKLIQYLAPVSTDPACISLQNISDKINQQINSLSSIIEFAQSSLDNIQNNKANDVTSLQSIDTQAKTLNDQQSQAVTIYSNYLIDINSQITALNIPLTQLMYSWMGTVNSLMQNTISELNNVLNQINAYDTIAKAAVANSSGSTKSLISSYESIISGYIKSVNTYITNADTYMSTAQSIYSATDSTEMQSVQDAYMKIFDLYNTVNGSLKTANQHLRDSAVQAANAQKPPQRPNIFVQTFSRIKTFFGG